MLGLPGRKEKRKGEKACITGQVPTGVEEEDCRGRNPRHRPPRRKEESCFNAWGKSKKERVLRQGECLNPALGKDPSHSSGCLVGSAIQYAARRLQLIGKKKGGKEKMPFFRQPEGRAWKKKNLLRKRNEENARSSGLILGRE